MKNMELNNGGSAFPFEGGDNNGYQPTYGMNLRDYLAAKAMQGFIAADWFSEARNFDLAASELADEAYLVADAMLKARAALSQSE